MPADKTVLHCLLQVHLDIRQRKAVDFPQEGIFFFIHGGRLASEGSCILIRPDLIVKHKVPDLPAAPEGPGKQIGLFRSRIYTIFISSVCQKITLPVSGYTVV